MLRPSMAGCFFTLISPATVMQESLTECRLSGTGTERAPYRQSICSVQVWSTFDTGIPETACTYRSLRRARRKILHIPVIKLPDSFPATNEPMNPATPVTNIFMVRRAKCHFGKDGTERQAECKHSPAKALPLSHETPVACTEDRSHKHFRTRSQGKPQRART